MNIDIDVRRFAFYCRLFANGFGLASLESILARPKRGNEDVELYAYHWAHARLQQQGITLEQLNNMTQAVVDILRFASDVEHSIK